MFTTSYKGYWIHGYCDKEECRVQCPDYSALGPFSNMQVAKRAIGRALARNH